MSNHAAVQKSQHEESAPQNTGSEKSSQAAGVGLPLFMQTNPTASAGVTLQRKCACGGTPGANDECATCNSGKPLQAKLAIGASDDPLKQKADRVADQVLAPHSALQAKLDSNTCTSVESRLGHDFSQVRAHPDSAAEQSPREVSIKSALQSPSEALDASMRRRLEAGFGQDFSSVRVHAGGAAQQSAKGLGAAAYTVGEHMVFGAERYAPSSAGGLALLRHELTHVVQQRQHARASDIGALKSARNDRAEMQADQAAAGPLPETPAMRGTIARPSALLSLAPEDWFRGEASGVPIAKDGGVVHDLGDGPYLTDRVEVAGKYAEMRAGKNPTGSVLTGKIDPRALGRVLDLTEEPAFMKNFNFVKDKLGSVSGEPYRNMVEGHLKLNGKTLDDYDVIIGPEGVRDGKQMCIRSAKAQEQVRANLVPVKVPGSTGRARSVATPTPTTKPTTIAGRGEPVSGIVASTHAQHINATRSAIGVAGMIILSAQLSHVRGAEMNKARDALAALEPTIEQHRQKGIDVTVTVIAEIPDLLDVAASATSVGNPSQVVLFRDVFISHLSLPASASAETSTMYDGGGHSRDYVGLGDMTLDQQIRFQFGDKYPVPGTGPHTGFHFAERKQVLPGYAQPKAAEPASPMATRTKGLAGTWTPEFRDVFVGDISQVMPLAARTLKVDVDASGAATPRMTLGSRAYAFENGGPYTTMVMTGRFKMGEGYPPQAQWYRSTFEYRPEKGLILELARGQDMANVDLWSALFLWRRL